MFKPSKNLVAASLCLGLSSGLAMLPATATAQTQSASEQIKVVYHINDAKAQALSALRNMRNHLDVAPKTKIIAIAHADGIDFLENDYEDADTVGPLIAGLAARGVKFEVCEITMKRKELKPDDFVMEAEFTPSGVVQLAELQAQENYAYIKP